MDRQTDRQTDFFIYLYLCLWVGGDKIKKKMRFKFYLWR